MNITKCLNRISININLFENNATLFDEKELFNHYADLPLNTKRALISSYLPLNGFNKHYSSNYCDKSSICFMSILD